MIGVFTATGIICGVWRSQRLELSVACDVHSDWNYLWRVAFTATGIICGVWRSQRLELSVACDVHSCACKVARFTSYFGPLFSLELCVFPQPLQTVSVAVSQHKHPHLPPLSFLPHYSLLMPHCNATNYEKLPTLNIAARDLFLLPNYRGNNFVLPP